MRRTGLLLVLAVSAAACDSGPNGAYAKRITAPDELIGGPGALGTLGDWLIGNEHIKVIIQDQGWSRGFGIFGGGIIDADLVRPSALGTADGGTGRDNFGEYFPTLFLQAFDVEDREERDANGKRVTVPGIEVISDGSDGGAAIVRTRARGGDFFTMVKSVIDAVVPQQGLRFETDYVLRPGTRHVEIIGRLKNTGSGAVDLSGEGIAQFFDGIDAIPIPLGDVALFGSGNTVFAPGAVSRAAMPGRPKPAGFDLRYAVQAAYGVPIGLPAYPGLVVDFLASAGPGVSYGIAVGDSENNYVWKNRAEYEKNAEVQVTKHSMVVPFLVSSFTGAFYELPPARLAPAGQEGDTYEYRKYFVVGSGDVGSIRDELYRIRGTATGTFEGLIVDELTGEPEREAWVHVLDERQRPFSQLQTDANGRFRGRLEPGRYHYRITAPGRRPTPGEPAEIAGTLFEVGAGAAVYRYIRVPPPGELVVSVRDATGRPMPAKVTVVSAYDARFDGQDPADFLFDMSVGEERRPTDLSWLEPAGARERRFIEHVELTPDGVARMLLRPTSCGGGTCETPFAGPYDVYVSRGPEYDLFVERGVDLRPGEMVELEATLHRVVDTSSYVSADLHVHSINSVDSFMHLTDRVSSAAAEGLEIAVATDHNYVTDYQPTINALGLQDWMTSVVGVELSTLEMGHFNGFPVRYDVGAPSHFPMVRVCHERKKNKVNGTAFDWVLCSPQQIFDGLRLLGAYGPRSTIVQVNHPRDSVLGYFNQYYVNPYTGRPEAPTPDNYAAVDFISPRNQETDQYAIEKFSFAFDALEVFNGKRLEMLHAFRVPNDAPPEAVALVQDHRCSGGHPQNGAGKVLLRKGGHIAYPGAIDDWLHMLNEGYTMTATGNSDSHGLDGEIGYPRNYIYVPPASDGVARDAVPSAISPLDLVEGIKSRRVMATNGPFVELRVSARDGGAERSWPMGSTASFSADHRGRAVTVEVDVRAAPWVSVDRLVLYANGKVLTTLQLVDDVPAGQRTTARVHQLKNDFVFDRDTVLVVEVYGDDSLFPIVTHGEEAPTTIASALGSLVTSMGLEGVFADNDGVTSPAYVLETKPFALTNPVWLDLDADGEFDPPGNGDVGPGPAPNDACPTPLRAAHAHSPAERIFGHQHGGARHYHRADIRKIFHGHHAH